MQYTNEKVTFQEAWATSGRWFCLHVLTQFSHSHTAEQPGYTTVLGCARMWKRLKGKATMRSTGMERSAKTEPRQRASRKLVGACGAGGGHLTAPFDFRYLTGRQDGKSSPL